LRPRILVFGTLTLLPACGAILDLPDPQIRDNLGNTDGSVLSDGAPLGDSAFTDGTAPPNDSGNNGDSPISPDDAAKCGGKDCFGGPCNTGNVCGAALVLSAMDPKYLAIDNNQLFVTSSTNKIIGVDVTDYSKVTTVTAGESDLVALEAGGGYVYFASSDMSEGANTEHLSRCAETGCIPATRVDYVTPQKNHQVGGIAFDNSNFYYSQDETTANNGGTFSCPIAGGSTCALLGSINEPGELRVDSSNLYWFEGPSFTGISNRALSTSATTTGQNIDITDFVLSGSKIYFSTQDKINVVDKPGAAIDNAPIYSSGANIIAIATDGTTVYWIDDTSGTTGTLLSCLAASCTTPTPLVPGLQDPTTGGLLVTSDSIYYTTQTDGNVWRLAR
jgi:hypothetical protein